jgi:hypothetical protein
VTVTLQKIDHNVDGSEGGSFEVEAEVSFVLLDGTESNVVSVTAD